MSLHEIYKATKAECQKIGRHMPPTFDDHIRTELQNYSAGGRVTKHRNPRFERHEDGVWSCNVSDPIEDLA